MSKTNKFIMNLKIDEEFFARFGIFNLPKRSFNKVLMLKIVMCACSKSWFRIRPRTWNVDHVPALRLGGTTNTFLWNLNDRWLHFKIIKENFNTKCFLKKEKEIFQRYPSRNSWNSVLLFLQNPKGNRYVSRKTARTTKSASQSFSFESENDLSLWKRWERSC